MSKPDEKLVDIFLYYLGVDLNEDKYFEFRIELAEYFSKLMGKSVSEFYANQNQHAPATDTEALKEVQYVHIHKDCPKCGGCIYECKHQVKSTLTTSTTEVADQDCPECGVCDGRGFRIRKDPRMMPVRIECVCCGGMGKLLQAPDGASAAPSEPKQPVNKQADNLSVPLRPYDIDLLLDHLAKGITEAKWKADPKRAERVYELYQSVGQALGEADISLQFRVIDMLTEDSTPPRKPSDASKSATQATVRELDTQLDKLNPFNISYNDFVRLKPQVRDAILATFTALLDELADKAEMMFTVTVEDNEKQVKAVPLSAITELRERLNG